MIMTAEEIKKALAQCSDNCIGCPYKPLDIPCQYQLKKDALDLITEQEKENERLKEQVETQRNEKWDAQDDLECYHDEIPNKIKQAVKEFAEKIKAKSYVNNYCREVVEIDKIDELLKEYENGKDKD